MATIGDVLDRIEALTSAYSNMLSPVGGSKLLTLNRAAGSDAALSVLQDGGAERWRYGMLAGDDDFVLQWSDGSELGYVDRLRIDGATGAVTIAGLALDGATLTGQSLFAAGSAAAPAIAAAGDVDTGLFFPAANALAAAVGGTEIWRATAAGLQVNGAMVVNGSNYKLDILDSRLRMQSGLGGSVLKLVDAGAPDRDSSNPYFALSWSPGIDDPDERLCYIGQGSGGNSDTYFVSDHGNIRIAPPSGSKVIIIRPLEMFDVVSAPTVLIGTTVAGASKLRAVDLPTSTVGLSTGDIWNDAGTLKVAA